jgi:hypothetical protein
MIRRSAYAQVSCFATRKLKGIAPLIRLHKVLQRLPDHHVCKPEQSCPGKKTGRDQIGASAALYKFLHHLPDSSGV